MMDRSKSRNISEETVGTESTGAGTPSARLRSQSTSVGTESTIAQPDEADGAPESNRVDFGHGRADNSQASSIQGQSTSAGSDTTRNAPYLASGIAPHRQAINPDAQTRSVVGGNFGHGEKADPKHTGFQSAWSEDLDSDAQSVLKGTDYSKNLQRLVADIEIEGPKHSIQLNLKDTNARHTIATPEMIVDGQPAGEWTVTAKIERQGQCLGQSLTWLENVHDFGMDYRNAKPDKNISGWRQSEYLNKFREEYKNNRDLEIQRHGSIKKLMDEMGVGEGERKVILQSTNRTSARQDQFAVALEHVTKNEGAHLIVLRRADWDSDDAGKSYAHAVAVSHSQGKLALYDPNSGTVSVQSSDENGVKYLAKALSNEYRLMRNIPENQGSDAYTNSVHVIQYGVRRERANPREFDGEAGPSTKRQRDETRQDQLPDQQKNAKSARNDVIDLTRDSGSQSSGSIVDLTKSNSQQSSKTVIDLTGSDVEPARRLDVRQRDHERGR